MATKRRTPEEGGGPVAAQQQPPAAEAAGRDELEARVEQLESELEDSRDRHLRLAADFENFKKRARQDQADTIQFANAGLIERLLPALDDFQRALEHRPDGTDEGWVRGLQLSVQKLEEVLAAQGLVPIESLGSLFDPKLHEAIGSEDSEEHPEDTVVSELRRGYLLNDRVVRPALVRVARRPALPAG